MNKVGIGQLKHAKTSSVKVKQKRTDLNARPHKRVQKSRRIDPPQEGQLAVDILQTDDVMQVICPIAGVEKGDINVSIQDDVLTIRGERKAIKGINHKEALVKELFWGVFSRSIVLPDHIDRKNISARVHEHMLIVSIPKTEDFRTRIIHINDSE